MILPSNLGNLGDNLILTPLLRSGLFDRVQMPDDATTRSAAQVYENLVPVEFVPAVTHCGESKLQAHRALCYLNHYGLSNLSPLPWMRLTDAEIEWARLFLAPYARPLAVNFTTMNKGGDAASAARSIPDHVADFVVTEATKRGYQCLNLGVSRNHTPRAGVIDILDLDVRKAAACYYHIGRYIGGESGPVHLMVANGGRVVVLHPDIDPLYYPGWMAHYTPEMFGGGPVRAHYVNKRAYQWVRELMDFEWIT